MGLSNHQCTLAFIVRQSITHHHPRSKRETSSVMLFLVPLMQATIRIVAVLPRAALKELGWRYSVISWIGWSDRSRINPLRSVGLMGLLALGSLRSHERWLSKPRCRWRAFSLFANMMSSQMQIYSSHPLHGRWPRNFQIL